MTRILGLFILMLIIFAAGNVVALAQISQSTFPGAVDLGVSEPQGVYCEVNGVRLFAKTAEDCQKASGKVTHVINTKVTPVGEPVNPNQEPEIQREKDKEPEAQ